MIGKIYIIKNDINDKVYIGKTLLPTIEDRFKEHLKDAPRRNYEHRPLYRAINKYGSEHFYIELIEECDISILSDREIYWINYYGSYSKGYNATPGGDGRMTYSLEDYQKMIDLFSQGKLIKEICNIFECDSDTVHRVLLNSGIENTQINAYKKNSKKVIALKNGQIIKSFNSQREAAQWVYDQKISTGQLNNISICIGRVCKNQNQRHTAYGYEWKYDID